MEKNLPIKLFKKRDNDKALNNLPVIKSETQGLRIRLDGEKLEARMNYFNLLCCFKSALIQNMVFLRVTSLPLWSFVQEY